jgi:hypothetical protein
LAGEILSAGVTRRRRVEAVLTASEHFAIDNGMTIVADVGTAHAQTIPSPRRNLKRALEYLLASGAAAIWINERGGVCSIHTGRFVGKSRETISTYWTTELDAALVARGGASAR